MIQLSCYILSYKWAHTPLMSRGNAWVPINPIFQQDKSAETDRINDKVMKRTI
mgnify:FL=1